MAVHHAHLFTKLVDKNRHGVGFGNHAGELAQGLAHQPGLQANEAVAHFALDFGLGNQRRHRVDDHDIHSAAAHQGFANFKRLLARIRLGNVKIVDVYAQLFGVNGIQRVLRVDKRGHAAHLLRFGYAVQGHGGFAAAFRAVNLNHAPARQAAHAQRHIQIQAARGDDLQIGVGGHVAELHYAALAVGFV